MYILIILSSLFVLGAILTFGFVHQKSINDLISTHGIYDYTFGDFILNIIKSILWIPFWFLKIGSWLAGKI